MLRAHALNRTPCLVPRRFGLVVFEGKLFAVGGRDGLETQLSSVETLSSATGAWATEANALNVARCGFAALPAHE